MDHSSPLRASRAYVFALRPLAVAGCVVLGATEACGTSDSASEPPSADAGPNDAGTASDGTVGTADGQVAEASAPTGVPVYLAGLNPSGFARSDDGHTWTDIQAVDRGDAGAVSGDNAVADIAFGAGIAVAVGDAGISITRDGRRWQLVRPGRLHSSVITFGRGRFVILSGGEILTSPDGFQWTSIPSTGEATHWHSVVFGAVGGVEQFVAVGDQWEFANPKPPFPAGRYKRSLDGITWEYVTIHRDTPEALEQVDNLVYGNGIVLGIAARDRPGIVYRYDGTSLSRWEKTTFGTDGGTVNPYAYGYNGSTFVIVDTAKVAQSTNGRDWSLSPVKMGVGGLKADFVPIPSYGGMSWASNHWVAPRPFHIDARVSESPDGIAWSAYWAPTAAEKALGAVSVLRYGTLAGK